MLDRAAVSFIAIRDGIISTDLITSQMVYIHL